MDIDKLASDGYDQWLLGKCATPPWEETQWACAAIASKVQEARVAYRYEDVRAILRDDRHFAHVLSGPGSSVFRNSLLDMEGYEHRSKGAVLARRIRSPEVLRTSVKGIVTTHTARLVESLRELSQFDIGEQLNERLPLAVISELLDIDEADQFREWYRAIGGAGTGNPSGNQEVRCRGEAALAELYRCLDPIISRRRRKPGDDLISDLLAADREGAKLSNLEVKAMVALALTGGVETTARALSTFERRVFSDEQVWRRLREDRALLAAAAAETLRLEPPVPGLVRMCRGAEGTSSDRDGGIRGVPIGERVYGSILGANHDPQRFEEPLEFIVDRFAGSGERQFSGAADHLAFGGGAHFCMGAGLAKVEMCAVMNSLLDSIQEFRIVREAADVVVGGRNSMIVMVRWIEKDWMVGE